MIRREDWYMILEQHQKGVYQKDIAHQLGVHPKTVSRALAREGPPSGKRQRNKPRKIEPFLDQIDALLKDGVWNGRVIYREIQQAGYDGGYSMVTDYLRPKRPLRPSRATVRFETPPGKQLQHDWGETVTCLGGEKRKVYVAVNTLGFSRRFHALAAPRPDAEHTYESLIQAMEWFGGVPEQVVVDNQKAAVLEHRTRRAVRYHQRFLDLAGHYGFRPHACQPRRAQTKGKIERMVGYVKHHFFVRYRSFDSFNHLNQTLHRWLLEEADQRVQGTVKEVVAERFKRERDHLGSLPKTRYDTSYLERRHVAWDGYVDVRGNRYSVPDAYCGKLVRIRISLSGRLRIDNLDGERIAEHQHRDRSKGWSTFPPHHRNLWHQVLQVERRDLQVYEGVV